MPEGNELAKIEKPITNELALGDAGGPAPFWCSWRTSTAVDKARLLKAMHGKVDSLADILDETIEVRHVLTQRIEVVSQETGEVVPSIRIVLIGPKDELYGCVSEYAWKSLQSIGSPQLFGPPPWEPPLRLKCVQYTSSRKRKFYNLEVCE
jgi:hypothetical protein